MSSLYHSVHAPKVFTLDESDENLEFAMSDAGLIARLRNSSWLAGRNFKPPAWLKGGPEISGDPSQISSVRLAELRDGATPIITSNDERRFVRNRAGIKQVAADLKREEDAQRSQNRSQSDMWRPQDNHPRFTPTEPRDWIELAHNDRDLLSRLHQSEWLRGKDYTVPVWLGVGDQPTGTPEKLRKDRLQELRLGDAPRTKHERRFLRNRAVVEGIMAELEVSQNESKSSTQPAVVTIRAEDPRLKPPVSTPGNAPPPSTASALTSTLKFGNAFPAINEVRQSSLSRKHESPSKMFNFGTHTAPQHAETGPALVGDKDTLAAPSQNSKLESDEQAADRLRRTVLAPFYDRIENDGKEIVRLREEKAKMAAELIKAHKEASTVVKGNANDKQQNGNHVDLTVAKRPDTLEETPRGIKRKASWASPMKLGDATNGHNEHTTDGHLLHLANKICKDLKEAVPNETIHLCGLGPIKIMDDRPDEVLDLAHKKLHAWPYQSVPRCWRRLYEDASLSKAAQILKQRSESLSEKPAKRRRIEDMFQEQAPDEDWIQEVVSKLDQGMALSGAPGRASIFEAAFQQLENFVPDDEDFNVPPRFNLAAPKPLETQCPILRATKPLPFEAFQRQINAQTTPVIIPGTLTQWPASQKWHEPAYFLRMTLGGRRLVPVEIGKQYTDSDWSQKIMTFRQFMKDYFLPKEPKDIAYLAQHDLFAQIPALRDDITIPDYCYTVPPEADEAAARTAGLASAPQLDEPMLNAWLGPKGTKTPLHTDPYHNILCQVVGYKYVRLYAPSETPKLYPRGTDAKGVTMNNTSQVDVSHSRTRSLGGPTNLDAIREQRRNFPEFSDAKYVEGILAPGECLYVPLGWWHFVESLSASFSVSFWWN